MFRTISFLIFFGLIILAFMSDRHPENNLENPLFVRFPLISSYESPVGKLYVPFHSYSSEALIIGCKANASAVQEVTDKEYHILRGSNDETIVFLWAMKYEHSSVGKYKEIVLTFPVSRNSSKATLDSVNTFAAFNEIYFNPYVNQYVYKLWVDSPEALEWGRTVVGFDKSMGENVIVKNGNKIEFSFTDKKTSQPVLKGHVIEDDSIFSQLLLLPEIIGNMGIFNTINYVSVNNVSPKGISPYFKKNNPITYSEFALNPLKFQMKFQPFSSNDNLEVFWPEFKAFNLKPITIARDPKARFLFTTPTNFVKED